jgi:ubiquinol-cytochrome c reductase iron-sulfur subunit
MPDTPDTRHATEAAAGSAAGEKRRDFLAIFAGALTAVGAAAALWPFIDSLEPSADVLARGAPLDVDLARVQPGQQIIVIWRGQPVFIVHRTPAELKILQDPRDTGLLRDPESEAFQQPGYAQNWHRSIKPDYLVLVGVCTHLGCVPKFEPQLGGDLGAAWPGGYLCPCHGSRHDLAGRVFRGVPAPYNLPVPPHRFVSDSVIRIGENPPGATFDFAAIEQI